MESSIIKPRITLSGCRLLYFQYNDSNTWPPKMDLYKKLKFKMNEKMHPFLNIWIKMPLFLSLTVHKGLFLFLIDQHLSRVTFGLGYKLLVHACPYSISFQTNLSCIFVYVIKSKMALYKLSQNPQWNFKLDPHKHVDFLVCKLCPFVFIIILTQNTIIVHLGLCIQSKL